MPPLFSSLWRIVPGGLESWGGGGEGYGCGGARRVKGMWARCGGAETWRGMSGEVEGVSLGCREDVERWR